MINAAVSTPIATGERVTNLAAFRDLFNARACEVCQVDITHCGGLSEARRIAALAEAHRIALAPHNPQGPVSTAASLEFGFAQPSYVICETVHADVPWRADVVQEGFTVEPKGRIVRPNDVAFGTDTFKHITGIQSATHLTALRAWVRGETTALPEARVRALQSLPTEADQQARAEFGLGEWLYNQGRVEAAARHFAMAGELAPHDFTIRRGTMPMRGIDPMGPQFREMLGAWVKAGNPYYRPLAE